MLEILNFDSDRQYVHQMKAEHILNSNLASKNTSHFKFLGKLGKIGFFKISASVMKMIFFFQNENFLKLLKQTTKLMFSNCFKHQKCKLQ